METNQIHEDLQHIKQMMARNQRSLVDNGLSYIINGIGIAIGVPVTMLMGFNGLESYILYVWLVLIAVMVAANLAANKRIEKNRKVITFGSEVFKTVWGACGVSIMIIFLLSFLDAGLLSAAFYVSCASILAIGYVLTGVINDLKFMKVLAIFWWLTAVTCGLWGSFGSLEFMPIFFSGMVLTLQLIPAFIIYKKWKRAYNG